MHLVVGSDHAGFALRQMLAAHLRDGGHTVDDVGTPDAQPCDYPVYAERVARAVVAQPGCLGVLVCGSGIGVSIAANRVHGAYAAVCCGPYTAALARAHNHANVLCLGARVTGTGLALAALDAFVAGHPEGGRHARRVALTAAMEGGEGPSAAAPR